MYIYVYTYKYIYVNIYVCEYICICIYVCIYIYIYLYITGNAPHIHIYIYTCICVCMYVCMYVYIYMVMRIMQNTFDEINKYNKYAMIKIFIRSIRYMPVATARHALVAPAVRQISTK